MKLKKIEVNSFAGINPHSPILLDFTQSKFIHVSGDQGLGKTSLINALLVACGQLSKNDKDFINLESGKIDINMEFVGKDRLTYAVRCTKSSFQLTYEGALVPEPIAKMRELLGVVGCSPMEIKSKPLKEIVKWLSSYSNKSAEEYDAEMKKHKDGLKANRDTRAAANKSAKGLAEWLESEPLFQNWEASSKKYVKAVNIKELSEELDAAGKKSDSYLRAEAKLKQLKERQESLIQQIAGLQAEVAEVEKSITVGSNYIKDNKSAKSDYDKVRERYDNAYKEMSAYNMWQQVKEKKKQKDEFEKAATNADNAEKEIIQKVKDLQAEILPDIKGVELVTEDEVDERGRVTKEGLYWEGKNVSMLSESEWWKIVICIWKKYRVKIVVIDNFSSLGSGAVEMLQNLVKDGAYVLAAEMDRQQKTLQINYE